jgi:hypothetical protein
MLDVFSGMPNPVFQPTDDLLTQIGELGAPSDDENGELGYRGFRVIETTEDPAAAATTADQVGTFTQSALISGNPSLEHALLDAAHAAGAVSDDLYGYVGGVIGTASPAAVASSDPAPDTDPSSSSLPTGPADPPTGALTAPSSTAVTCPPCGGADAPTYDAGYWNNDPTRLNANNCYAYVNNQPTNTFAQPGRGTGQQWKSLDCDDVRSASERDGLVTAGSFQASRAGWYGALVIWPGFDYHWYRQDASGCWSHKPGHTKVRDVDHAGQPIADPSQCDRGPYTTFCTFMATSSSVTIK